MLRRIIRRAVQQAHRIGLHDVHRLSRVVIEQMGAAYPELPPQADEIARVLRLEEERFSETLERGLKLFDDLGSSEAITGEQAFTLAATYGFPLELTVELAEERGQAVDLDAYREEMERHREVSRAGGSSEAQRAADFARAADFETEFVGYAKTDVLTQIGALEELGDGHFLAKLRESPFYPAGGGQVTDVGTIELDDAPETRAELVDAYRLGVGPGAPLPRGGVRRRRPRARARAVVDALRDDGEPHGHAPPPPGAAGGARRARAPGRVGRAPRQAALRLHARAGTHRRGARGGRAPRERDRLRESPGARLRDADRRGAEARGDDALRREVRRHRPRGRGSWVLGRAVRRDAREQERRGRAHSSSSPRAPSALGFAASRP